MSAQGRQRTFVLEFSQYKNFDSVNTEFLDGFIEDIVVSPTFDENRDGKRVQVGHKLNVNFRLPIVNDRIEYLNPKNKSKGYNLVKGKKKLNVGSLSILKGGRGKIAKKKHRI